MKYNYEELEIVKIAKRIELITNLDCYIELRDEHSSGKEDFYTIFFESKAVTRADNNTQNQVNTYGLVLFNKNNLDRIFHMDKMTEILGLAPEVSYLNENNFWTTVWVGEMKTELMDRNIIDNKSIIEFYREIYE